MGLSLEDGFNLPILEAMACGLPVIASIQTGASENIADRENGLILNDPHGDALLANFIRQLYVDGPLRGKIAQAVSDSVRQNCRWEQNAPRTKEVLEEILQQPSAPDRRSQAT